MLGEGSAQIKPGAARPITDWIVRMGIWARHWNVLPARRFVLNFLWGFALEMGVTIYFSCGPEWGSSSSAVVNPHSNGFHQMVPEYEIYPHEIWKRRFGTLCFILVLCWGITFVV